MPSLMTWATAASSFLAASVLAKVLQHQDAGEDQGGGVHLPLPLVLRGRAVGRLEDGAAVLADVRPGGDAQAADEPGAEVGEDVAVEVGQDQDVVQLGLLHELHAHVVDDPVLEFDVGVRLGDLAADFEEEAVGELEDVRLVDARDLLPAVLPGVLEGVLDDPLAPGDGDRLDRDPRVGADGLAVEPLDVGDQLGRLGLALFEFAAEVEVLGVLADDDEVDLGLVEVGPDAFDSACRGGRRRRGRAPGGGRR